jgi:hypothetical protein
MIDTGAKFPQVYQIPCRFRPTFDSAAIGTSNAPHGPDYSSIEQHRLADFA